jgi:hypothetical protein
MQKPFKYFAIHKETKEIRYFNNMMFKPYNPLGIEYKWTIYIDTRYEAKLRLYNYVTFSKKGIDIPRYKPFKGTEIGKSIPILNF